MMDKSVVMCDFKGIKPGMIVRVHDGWHDLPITGGMMGVVIDRITYPRMVDEGRGARACKCQLARGGSCAR